MKLTEQELEQEICKGPDRANMKLQVPQHRAGYCGRRDAAGQPQLAGRDGGAQRRRQVHRRQAADWWVPRLSKLLPCKHMWWLSFCPWIALGCLLRCHCVLLPS